MTRETCFKASLLPSTMEAGISCGYMEIEIEEPLATERRKTCFLYDQKVVETGILDEATKFNLNALAKKNEDDKINYKFVIYNSTKNGYIYDSKTQNIKETIDTYTPPNHSPMSKVAFINYFLLIILLSL